MIFYQLFQVLPFLHLASEEVSELTDPVTQLNKPLSPVPDAFSS